jgi:hypothetical protein
LAERWKTDVSAIHLSAVNLFAIIRFSLRYFLQQTSGEQRQFAVAVIIAVDD